MSIIQNADQDDAFELRNFSAIMEELESRPDAVSLIRDHLEDLVDAAVDDLWQISVVLYGWDAVDVISEVADDLAILIAERGQLPKGSRKALAKAIDSKAYQQAMVVACRRPGHC
jgi:hypothetical protein